jgi:hypothetical protein
MDTEQLRALIEYRPDTGELIRKVDLAANAKAGTTISGKNACGYVQTVVRRQFFYAHRLAWQLYYGEEPAGEVDHINGNRSDNRIENLRIATGPQNKHNARLRRDNTSGAKGVSWNKASRKWVACVTRSRRVIFRKLFDDRDEAIAAVRSAREQIHGSFANHGD